MDMVNSLNLDNLGRGIVKARFLHELDRVLENIQDRDTDATVKRTIKLSVAFTPNEDRNFVGIEVSSDAKLAPLKAVGAHAHVGRVHGKAVATPHNVEQAELFPEESARPTAVRDEDEEPDRKTKAAGA
jgi:hypothetical protein